ncbi:MAG: glutaredoxin family protein [bacterium]
MSRVTIYTNPDCIYCKRVKDFLRKHKVEFSEKDVSRYEKAAEEMVKKSGQLSAPVIVARLNGKDNIVIGTDFEKLSEILMV